MVSPFLAARWLWPRLERSTPLSPLGVGCCAKRATFATKRRALGCRWRPQKESRERPMASSAHGNGLAGVQHRRTVPAWRPDQLANTSGVDQKAPVRSGELTAWQEQLELGKCVAYEQGTTIRDDAGTCRRGFRPPNFGGENSACSRACRQRNQMIRNGRRRGRFWELRPRLGRCVDTGVQPSAGLQQR